MIRPRTIRAKLTLTTVVVMGTLLAVLGIFISLSASRSLLGGIDEDLRRRGMESEEGYARAMARRQDGDRRSRSFRPPNSDPLRTLRPRFFPIESALPSPDSDQKPYDPKGLAEGRRGRLSFETIQLESQPVRIHTRPIFDNGRVAAVVQIPFGLSDTYRSLDNLRRILLFMIPVGAALTGLASLFLIDRLIRPLRLITQNAEQIGANTLAERIPVVGRDEFAYLGTTLNGMLNRLQGAFETEQETSRRLEASLRQQKRFTADASHELKTPLAVILANTSLVRTDETTPTQDEGLGAIDDAAERMNRLVKGLLQLSKAESGTAGTNTEPCILAEVARRAIRQTIPVNTRIEVEVLDETATTIGVFEDLVRMVQNLMDNALQHAGGDEIGIVVRRGGAWGEIEVRDNGRGISPEHLPFLFDRFYRVDESRNSHNGGTGLGLAIARGIAESHGGSLTVQSTPGRGTSFVARLGLSI